jgi:flagellar basal-body rod protein FlgB
MNEISNPMIQMLQRFLNVASQRHTLVTTNIANIDTPGYRTRDLDFRSELERAVSGEDDGGGEVTPVARMVPGLLERPDGNNVNIDREGLLLAETQMQFNVGVELIHDQFSQIMMAINEGGKG